MTRELLGDLSAGEPYRGSIPHFLDFSPERESTFQITFLSGGGESMELDPVETTPPEEVNGESPDPVITKPDGTEVRLETIYAVEQVPVIVEHPIES